MGSTFENLLYLEFVKQGYEIYYYNKDFECDFICKKDNQLIAVQVCYELTPHNRDRELNGLKKLKIDTTKKLLITYNQNEKSEDNIEIIAFWDYFS